MPKRFRLTLWLLGLLLATAAAQAQPGPEPPPASPPTADPAPAAPAPAAPGPAADGPPSASPPAQPGPTDPWFTALPPPSPSQARLLDLHKRVDSLKEQIRQTHRRLSGLHDIIFEDSASSSRLDLRLDNKLSAYFVLTRVLVLLDGAVQYHKKDTNGSLDEQRTIPIYEGPVHAGPHTVQVVVGLQGNGWGPVAYFRSYRFTVRSTYSFTTSGGQPSRVRIVLYEKGDSTTPFEERPAVHFAVRTGLSSKR